MGLGKTLEVIALILARPFPEPLVLSARPIKQEGCVCGMPADEGTEDAVACGCCKSFFHADCVEARTDDSAEIFYCDRCRSFADEPPVDASATLIVRLRSIVLSAAPQAFCFVADLSRLYSAAVA